MERRVDTHVASTRLAEIIELATQNDERFIVDRRGEPAVVIMSIHDFVRTIAPPPGWLENAWAGSKARGLDTMTLDDINAEIDAHRHEQEIVAPKTA